VGAAVGDTEPRCGEDVHLGRRRCAPTARGKADYRVSDFVRLRAASTKATDQQDLGEIVVNRHYISHLLWRYDHTEVHFGNGDRTINVRESPAKILTMEPWRITAERSGPTVDTGPSRSDEALG